MSEVSREITAVGTQDPESREKPEQVDTQGEQSAKDQELNPNDPQSKETEQAIPQPGMKTPSEMLEPPAAYGVETCE